MPFKDHPHFLPPDSPDTRLWRFMDLEKYISILDSKALYFSRIDKLSKFDSFEGYLPYPNVMIENVKYEDLPNDWKESTGVNDPRIFSAIVDAQKHTRTLLSYHREVTFVSSWYLKEHESAAMWKLYLSNNAGIAIRSSYQRLVDSLEDYTDYEIHIGRIKYIDYKKEAIPSMNLLSPFMYKRRSYEHEDELRALIWTPQHGKNDILDPSKNKYKDTPGIHVPVILESLIDKVFVAPNAPGWTVDLITSITRKYGLNKVVDQSDLASAPFY